VARDLARAIAVRPLEGREAWFSGVGDARTASLAVPAPSRGELSFGLWYDTEAGFDILTLEASTDDGASWSPVPFSIDAGTPTDGTLSGYGGRRWHDVTATLPSAEDVQVRWRYASDSTTQGRGVYVDRVRIDGKRVPDRMLIADGWELSAN
jgi:hypothetical protein